MLIFEGSNPAYRITMGDDKVENELLIKWGWPEDIWFHVDDYSSAHIYVRLPRGQTIDDLPEEVINEVAQLTKGNSIEGSRQAAVNIVYTPWENLRKDHSTMDTGTIGFHDQSKVRKLRNVAKDKELLKTLEKTRKKVACDFEREKRQRDREQIAAMKQKRKEEAAIQKQKEADERRMYNLKHYVDLQPAKQSEAPHGDGTMDDCKRLEEDFM